MFEGAVNPGVSGDFHAQRAQVEPILGHNLTRSLGCAVRSSKFFDNPTHLAVVENVFLPKYLEQCSDSERGRLLHVSPRAGLDNRTMAGPRLSRKGGRGKVAA